LYSCSLDGIAGNVSACDVAGFRRP